jgi:hypothetical protein
MPSAGKKIRYYFILRLAFAFFPICAWFASDAQVFAPGPVSYPLPIQTIHFPDLNQIRENRITNQKWFWSSYTGVSIGTAFYPAGNAYMLSTPVGLQLNRRLNKNLYAFGNVFLAPTFTSFGSSFMRPTSGFPYSQHGLSQNYFSINPGVQMGLMYVNDDGTFSISGSVHASTTTYPVPPPPLNSRKK